MGGAGGAIGGAGGGRGGIPLAPPSAVDQHAALIQQMELLPDHFRRLCAEILRPAWQKLRGLSWPALWRYHEGNPFVLKLTPKNAAASGVPNYFDIITTPMDLTRVQERISQGKYTAAEQFFTDLALITANAKKYNRPPSTLELAEPPEPARVPLEELKMYPVYRIAWEFDQAVAVLKGSVTQAWAQAEYNAKKAVFQQSMAMMGMSM